MTRTFEQLLDQFLQETISPEDLQLFLAAAKQPENEEAIKGRLFHRLESKAYQGIAATGDMEIKFRQMLEKADWISKNEPKLIQLDPSKKFFNTRRIAVAASIILAIGLGSYFMFFNKTGKQTEVAKTQQERFKNDILPVNEGAVLTLANGRKIFLDSVSNGVLTKEGNVHVTKQGEQIVYTGNAGTAVFYNTMATQKGKQYMLLLADGSKAWLNAASSITYPTAFTGSERNVEVTGEVYFEIAHNESMPFKVKKKRSDATIEVLGTHFNVNAYNDEESLKVTLLEGSVKVISTASRNNVVIKPGQQAKVNADGDINVSEVNTEKIMAWRNNLFWFDNEEIPAIMRELARWYDADVVYEGNVTSRYGFVLERNLPISKLLKVLELTGGIHFVIDGKKIIVTK